MFYSKFLFVKKGPLSKIWLAACQRKLSKAQITETDIEESVDSIQNPVAPLALRLSGQLLLGLVRIYQRKIRYLQDDLSDTLTKMRVTFRPGQVDLPTDHTIAPIHTITLSENINALDFEIDMPMDVNMILNNDVFSYDDEYKYYNNQKQNGTNNNDDDEFKMNESKFVVEEPELPLDVPYDDEEAMNTTFVEPDYQSFGDVPDTEIPLDLPEQDNVINDYIKPPDFALDIPSSPKTTTTRVRKPKRRRLEVVDPKTELSQQQIDNHLKNANEISNRNAFISMAPTTTSSFLTNVPSAVSSMLQRIAAIDVDENANIVMKDNDDDNNNNNSINNNDYEQEAMDISLPDIDDMFDESMMELQNAPAVVVEDPLSLDTENDDMTTKQDGWSQRTQKMYHFLSNRFKENDTISYNNETAKQTRRVAAGMFHELLVLASHDYINVKQEMPYADIAITATNHFNKPLPAC